jgi:2-polyprenyl-3-methyl-5-hydroxy-6-metoxy-1,4-benzoquinol methylase
VEEDVTGPPLDALTEREKRLANERSHALRLLAAKTSEIWGWSGVAGGLRLSRRIALLIEHGRLGPSIRTLELGCGMGLLSGELARTGARLTAIDVSPEMIDEARRRSPGGAVAFEVLDAMDTGFPDGSFDAIVGCSVLHHLEPLAALKECHRLLVHGGRAVFSEPNLLNPQLALQKNIPLLKRLAGDSPDETAFVRWRLARTLKDAGLEIVRIEPFDFLHPATPEAVVGAVSRLGVFLERLPVVRELAGSLLVVAQK